MPSTCILVVYDPTVDAQPALARATVRAQSAGATDLRLHVYSCIHAKIPKSENKAARKAELIAAQEKIVKNAVSALVEQGVHVTTEVEWDKDWYQAVVRTADRIEADAVFKSSHKHSPSQRLLKQTSDRTLLRQCACPVFLVKTDEDLTSPSRTILAAVHYRGEAGVYDQLNKKIMDFCQRLIPAASVKVHFVSAYTELSERPDKGQLVRACGVPSDQVHIRMGETDDVIVDAAQELGANLVVIGNSARTGLSAVINTNTAEKILDRLDCNLLAMP
jgi:universal stress protein E